MFALQRTTVAIVSSSSIFLVAGALAVVIPAQLAAQESPESNDVRMVIVDSARLFYRKSGDSKNSYEELAKETRVQVLGERMDGDEKWLRVNVVGSKRPLTGWMHHSTLSPMEASTASNGGIRSSIEIEFPVDPESITQLGLKLLRQPDDSENPSVSPYGIWANSRLWLHGARGDTAKFMQEALGYSDTDARVGETGEGLLSEHRLLNRPKLVLLPEYQEFLSQQRCQTTETDFDEASMKDLNDWIRECSGEKMSNFFDKASWPSNVDALFINVTSVQTPWASPFRRVKRDSRRFTNSQGKRIAVTWMATLENLRFLKSRKYSVQAVVVPTENSHVAALIIVPTGKSDIAEVLKQIQPDVIREAFGSEVGLVDLEMPEFRASGSQDIFNRLGIQEALTKHTDFSGISTDPVNLSAMVQASEVAVTENGISAIAVTYTTATVSGPANLIEPNHRLIVDRPFLFWIIHVPTQTPLFMTSVNNPAPGE
jgi:serine protease inhibitor